MGNARGDACARLTAQVMDYCILSVYFKIFTSLHLGRHKYSSSKLNIVDDTTLVDRLEYRTKLKAWELCEELCSPKPHQCVTCKAGLTFSTSFSEREALKTQAKWPAPTSDTA